MAHFGAVKGQKSAQALSGVTTGRVGKSYVTGGSIAGDQGICMNTPTSIRGDSTFGRHMQVGVLRSDTQGNPSAPCLQLDIPGMWRFRWAISVGLRTIRINCLQASNGSPRPTMVVKANSAIGLAADITATAGLSTGWVTVGPASFTATAAGVVWVELWNNYFGAINTPTYWDHIVAT